MADIDLPVFPFRVNWRNGLTERLEWKTDVLTGLTGNEQRRGLRLTPRREFEATITVHDVERSFFDMWLHRMLDNEMLIPLWHDSVRTSAGAASDDTEVLVDTRGLEFRDGSLGLLRGLSALSFEVVEIETVEDDRLVLSTPLVGDWPKGTRVEPLRRGRMTDQTQLSVKSSRVAEGQAAFELVGEQPFDEGVWPGDMFMGYPVITEGPNRSQSVDQEFQWAFSTSDSETGARYRKSDVGRAMVNQKHSWLLRGRERKQAFREFLYQCKGQLSPVWLPTFNDDFFPAQPVVAASASLYVRETGFTYTGGVSSGREYIQIVTRTGVLYRRITGTAAAPAGQERLLVTPPFPAALTVADIRRISFMDTARFQNDQMEFNHVNAADGASTVAGIMQTFRDDREPPAILSLPIPVSAMSDSQCGDEAGPETADPCRPRPPCPPYPVFLTFGTGPRQCNTTFSPELLLSAPPGPVVATDGARFYQKHSPLFITNEFHPEGFWSEGKLFNVGGSRSLWIGSAAEGHYEFLEKDTRDTEWHDPRLEGEVLWQVDFAYALMEFQYNFAIGGDWYCQVQFPGGFCGSVGQVTADFNILMCETGGNFPNCECIMALRKHGEVDGSFYFEFNWNGP